MPWSGHRNGDFAFTVLIGGQLHGTSRIAGLRRVLHQIQDNLSETLRVHIPSASPAGARHSMRTFRLHVLVILCVADTLE